MIDRLSVLATRLQFLRPLLAVLGLLAFGVALFELFGGGLGERDYLPTAVLALLWALVGFAGIGLFADVPPAINDGPFLSRAKRNISRFFFFLLAMSFAALTLTGVYMTYKLISIGS